MTTSPAPSIVIGLDLTAGPRPATLAAVADDRQVLAMAALASDDEILAFIGARQPAVVAIDSPIGLPRGLCCLEASCPCAPSEPGHGRACERALSWVGIPSYYTTKRSIIKAMVYRAMALRRALEAAGYPVLETYPYGVKVRLFGRPLPRKSTPAGKRFIEARLADLLGRSTGPLTHDEADALLCAETGWRWLGGATEPFGWPDEGQIHLPRAVDSGVLSPES